MVAPAAGTIAQQFHITNEAIIAMTTSIFILGYGEYQITSRYIQLLTQSQLLGRWFVLPSRASCINADRVSFSAFRTSERTVWSLSSSATRELVVSWFVPRVVFLEDLTLTTFNQPGISAVVLRKVKVN